MYEGEGDQACAEVVYDEATSSRRQGAASDGMAPGRSGTR